MFAILFIFGVAIGSFINVLSLRYDEEKNKILFTSAIQGRSRCRDCAKVLCWYELIPLVSYGIQCGTCRGCKKPLLWQYPLIELATGLLTASLPIFLYQHLHGAQLTAQGLSLVWVYIAIGLWLLAVYTAITLAAIDLRLKIIPDQANILLALIGVILVAIKKFGLLDYANFSGSYATMLGAPANPIFAALIAAGFALALFGGIVYLTKERGMGLGDVKLAIPLALILGWPDALIAFSSSFVIGSLVGLLLIAKRKATMKHALPFGPFLIIGLFVAVFWSETILRWYFGLI